jgi:glycosyltransferase involved in cell wall biosynthesis
MNVSVIVPAHNDRAHLARLLEALAPGLRAHSIEAEVIVVANGCTDGTEAYCDSMGVTCLTFAAGMPPGAARNVGARFAKGRWLAFLDADVLPLDAWFRAAARRVQDDDSGVAVGWPYLVPPNSPWLPLAWEKVRMAGGRLPRYINAGNLLVSRALFERLGGFCDIRVAGEDADFCARVTAAGSRLCFDPELQTHHFGEPATIGGFLRRQFFHAEPLRTVFANAPRSALSFAIMLIIFATGVGLVGAFLIWPRDIRVAFGSLAIGPLVLVAMAVGKAASGWRGRTRFIQKVQMVLACAVLFLARAIGTIWLPPSVRIRTASPDPAGMRKPREGGDG